MNTNKTAVATMHNYSIHVFMSMNRVECPHAWLFHVWLITQDMSIPRYEKRGPHKHIMRFTLSVLCYQAFPRVKK